jgi:iduronate 2-sulfatase
MRTERYRLVVWKDRTHFEKKPLFIELFDCIKDPKETNNIADSNQELVNQLLVQFGKGWEGNRPTK